MTWKSYYIHFEEGLGAAADSFLVNELYPEIQRQEAAGRLRRYFFIRYSEGGPHVRLRLLPVPNDEQSARLIEAGLVQCISAYGARLEIQGYDRSQHYFGETLESVYAELLNVATSRISFALLQHFGAGRRGERWIALTCVLGSLLLTARTQTDRKSLAQDLEECRGFALRAGQAIGLGPEEAGETAGRRWAKTVTAAWPRVVSGFPLDLLKPTTKLLRRARLRGPEGRDVAIHALHLLCNKTGFSLAEEHEAFATLALIKPFSKEAS